MNRNVKILVLAGSYRRGSFNQALIAAAREEAPHNAEFDDFDLREVPFYDGDVESAGLPLAVERLNLAVRSADALLLVTPEYNSGLPAVLKNGIDWSSRGYPDAPLNGKLVAIMGASPGRGGTRMAQEHLRQVMGRTGALLPELPELMLAKAGDFMDAGKVHTEDLRSEVRAIVSALVGAVELCADQGSQAVAM